MANITSHTFEPEEQNTIIAALIQFKEAMSAKNALGDDEIGEKIRMGYLHQCNKLLLAIAEVSKK